MLIAIDGPAASGKGTVSKNLAKKLGLEILPTGNIYRAIAKKSLNNNEDVLNIAKNLTVKDLFLDNLGDENIGKLSSNLAAIADLREITYKFQRDFINQTKNLVIEGRDIGTVICPEADYKFFITADLEIRAQRRFVELKEKKYNISYEEVFHNLQIRDNNDITRECSPLKKAEDAIIIDTSKLNIDEVLSCILFHING